MDNVIFSKDTIWSNHTDVYKYYKNKIGRVIINDAVNIHLVKNESYDFCFSSHSLEHIANPIKAICDYFKCTFVYSETIGLNRWFIIKKPAVSE
jgi:hypothetical protein